MRCVLLVSGGGDIQVAKKACLGCDMVVLLHAIDQSMFSDLPPADFAEILQTSEETVEEIEAELRAAGINVRVESAWGPVKEKLKNTMKLWDAEKAFVLTTGSRVGEKLKSEIGKARGVSFI